MAETEKGEKNKKPQAKKTISIIIARHQGKSKKKGPRNTSPTPSNIPPQGNLLFGCKQLDDLVNTPYGRQSGNQQKGTSANGCSVKGNACKIHDFDSFEND